MYDDIEKERSKSAPLKPKGAAPGQSVYINAPKIFAACGADKGGAAQFPRGDCSEL